MESFANRISKFVFLIFISTFVGFNSYGITFNKCYETIPKIGGRSIDCLIKNSKNDTTLHIFYYNDKNEIIPYNCFSQLELVQNGNVTHIMSRIGKISTYITRVANPLETGFVSYTEESDESFEEYFELPLSTSASLIKTSKEDSEDDNSCLSPVLD